MPLWTNFLFHRECSLRKNGIYVLDRVERKHEEDERVRNVFIFGKHNLFMTGTMVHLVVTASVISLL